MNTHRALVNRLLWMQDEYELSCSDAVLQKTPASFDVLTNEIRGLALNLQLEKSTT